MELLQQTSINAFAVGAFIATLVAIYLIRQVFLLRKIVPTNMIHNVQSGKHTTPYGKGQEAGAVYYAWPAWIPHFGVVVSEFPESIFDISLDNYEAYDSGRLPFIVDIKAFFRVSDSPMAAQRVSSFHELREQLQSILQSAVRSVLGKAKLENIMEERSTLGSMFTDEVNADLTEWGVMTVKSIEFMDIRDSTNSQVIKNIMAKEQSRIDKESRIVVADNKREAELKEIDAERTVEVQRQDAEQQVGIRTAEKEQVVGIKQEQAKQEVVSQAKVTAEREMEVLRVNSVQQAAISREVAEIQANQDKTVSIVKAEAAKETMIISAQAAKENQVLAATATKESQVLEAEGQKTTTELLAGADLVAAQNAATGIAATGKAQAEAEAAMLLAPVTAQLTLAKEIGENLPYQQYLTTIKQIEVQGEVGKVMAGALSNADVKIISNGGDIQSGASNVLDMLTTTKGGSGIGNMLTSLAQTPEGAALVGKVTGMLAGKGTDLPQLNG